MHDEELEGEMEMLSSAVRSLKSLRTEFNVNLDSFEFHSDPRAAVTVSCEAESHDASVLRDHHLNDSPVHGWRITDTELNLYFERRSFVAVFQFDEKSES